MRPLLLAALLAACSHNPNEQRSIWMTRALPAAVFLSSEPILDPASGDARTVLLEAIVTDIGPSEDSDYQQKMALRTRDDVPHALYFTLAPNVPFPIRPGENIVLQYRMRWDKTGHRLRRALVIQDGRHQTRLVFQEDELLAGKLIPKAIRLRPGKRVAYTEAGYQKRLCYAMIEHRVLHLGAGSDGQVLAPGERLEVNADGARFMVVAVDNANALKEQCEDGTGNRLAWFAVRLHSSD